LQSCGEASEVPVAESEQLEVTVTRSDEGYLFQEGEAPIVFYQSVPKSFDGAYTRNNYLHPLWTLDGEILTEDGPEDHLHQRGVFWTWHQTYVEETRLGDAWACHDFGWDVAESKVEELPGGSKALAVKVLWKSPAWVDQDGKQLPVVQEDTRIVVHAADSSYRAIDVEIALRALVDAVMIGGSEDEKGYGGFSARITMPEDLSFSSAGEAIEARTTQVEAGPWMNFEGSFGGSGRKSALAIFVHPSNPGDINQWILRKRGSMQNPVFPGREPVLISKDIPTVLKYRLVLHRGAEDAPDLATLYGEYAGQS
jgi:hypothetical protein